MSDDLPGTREKYREAVVAAAKDIVRALPPIEEKHGRSETHSALLVAYLDGAVLTPLRAAWATTDELEGAIAGIRRRLQVAFGREEGRA
jgi:hypothetical protein